MKPKKYALTALIIGLMLSSASAADVISLQLEYDRGSISGSAQVSDGVMPNVIADDGRYAIRMTDEEGDTLYSREFGFDREVNIEGRPDRMLNQTSKEITLPYRENASSIKIYEEGQQRLDLQLNNTESLQDTQQQTQTQETSLTDTILIVLGLLLILAILTLTAFYAAMRKA